MNIQFLHLNSDCLLNRLLFWFLLFQSVWVSYRQSNILRDRLLRTKCFFIAACMLWKHSSSLHRGGLLLTIHQKYTIGAGNYQALGMGRSIATTPVLWGQTQVTYMCMSLNVDDFESLFFCILFCESITMSMEIFIVNLQKENNHGNHINKGHTIIQCTYTKVWTVACYFSDIFIILKLNNSHLYSNFSFKYYRKQRIIRK